MAGKAMVALGRVVLAKRERVIMLQPWGKGLMGTTLRYAYEVRETASYFDDLSDVSVPQDMLKLVEAPTVKAKTKRPSKRIEGQREMLLPIAGKKTAETKPAAQTTKVTGKRKAG